MIIGNIKAYQSIVSSSKTRSEIRGMTTELGVGISAIVRLYDEQTPSVFQEVISDKNSNYSFKGCEKGKRYTLIAVHISKKFNSVIQANVVAK
ncbi:carboxypeptidase regulatory-like domain-containing protein [Acinetobacter wuhouensis]|uniref:carboxypeptidase regulatory-like domain-containing protein n=1 Tax=Acinetobacter wuhouensis TaxID=1879050 RepID=UPI001022E3A0|nr:carboxypeptidase regulatory-like domain-containing protein [Acinetobacter wuhouensis]RZG71919.1 carboxypeptidase regulatory-like domain-containing protein [Acinetobacter wuhouensis]